MAGMRPDEAKQFHEDDEDPARVFAIFDAAKREGRLRRTERPTHRPDPIALRVLLADLAADLRKLRLRDRIARALHHLADAIGSRPRVH
jgi:hypothetical protein